VPACPGMERDVSEHLLDVLGDRDELLIGARFADGQELTCVAFIDHNMIPEVKDAFFVPDLIGKVLAATAERIADPDTSFVDMSLADARAWIHHGLKQFLPILDSVPCRISHWCSG
jgi:hypothetical protein